MPPRPPPQNDLINGVAVLPEQAKISWREGRNQKFAVHRIHRTVLINRVFKIRYGKGLLRLHNVKITSGDVTTRVVVRVSCRSLVFCCVKLPSLPYSSLREY